MGCSPFIYCLICCLTRLSQNFCRVLREIGYYNVRSGALYGGKALHHYLFPVYPTLFRRRLYHRILAAHVIRRGRVAELVLDHPYYIEIRERGLYHYYVRSFFYVEGDLS